MMKIAGCALLISAFIVLAVAEPFSPQDVDAELYSQDDVENEGRFARWLPKRPTPSPTFPKPHRETRYKRGIHSGPASGSHVPRPIPRPTRPLRGGRVLRSLPNRVQRPTPSPTFPRPYGGMRGIRSLESNYSRHVPLDILFKPSPTIPEHPQEHNNRF